MSEKQKVQVFTSSHSDDYTTYIADCVDEMHGCLVIDISDGAKMTYAPGAWNRVYATLEK